MNLRGLRIFLAAPYSQWMNPHTGEVHQHRRDRLDALRMALVNEGARVFSAHHNERWGAGWLPADECTPADFRAMSIADVVCAIVGNPASGGVAVELGWASALSKPVLVAKAPDAACTPLIDGLGTVTKAVFIDDDDEWGEDFFRAIVAGMAKLLDADPVTTDQGSADAAFVGSVEGQGR